MMREIPAFQSDDGRLHSNRHDAAVADLVSDLRKIWPREYAKERGEAYGVAAFLASSADVRVALVAALERFEKAEAA